MPASFGWFRGLESLVSAQSFLSSLFKMKETCMSDQNLEKSFIFSEPSLILPDLPECQGPHPRTPDAKGADDMLGNSVASIHTVHSIVSYDMFAAQQSVTPFDAARLELVMLEEQAEQLRATISRRTKIEGASNAQDDVSNIVAHYEQTLEELQCRINQLRQFTSPAKQLEF